MNWHHDETVSKRVIYIYRYDSYSYFKFSSDTTCILRVKKILEISVVTLSRSIMAYNYISGEVEIFSKRSTCIIQEAPPENYLMRVCLQK